MKTAVKDIAGKKLKEIELNKTVFGISPNIPVVHQVVKAQLAGERAGSADTKTRAEVRGGGKKPWRQKGTGRARAGSIRSPLWKGGGTVFGPTPRSYAQKVPRKIAKLALRSILSSKAQSGNLIILDKVPFEKASTKQAQTMLDSLNATGKRTVVVADHDDLAIKSMRNINKTRVLPVSEVNPYDLVDCEYLLVTSEALERLTEVLGGE